jgi:hypothetical protein
VLRQGHLSETALAEALLTGDRPAHLDRCDLCAERAVEFGRWLDQIKTVGVDAADAAFPPERLAIQQAQILRRLEQLDQPARVIAFPSQYRLEPQFAQGRRVAPRWVGIAAAAGLALGVIGGQVTARMTMDDGSATAPTSRGGLIQTPAGGAIPSLLDFDSDETTYPLNVLDEMTPRQTDVVATSRVGG